MPTDETRDIIRRFLDSIQTANAEESQALMADDMTWVVPGDLPPSGTHVGRNAVLKAMGSAFVNFESGSFKIDIHSVLVDGEGAAVEWTATARLRKGGEYKNHYAFFYEVRDGKIQAMREYADTQYAERVLFS